MSFTFFFLNVAIGVATPSSLFFPAVFALIQVVSRVPQTAARQLSATGRTSDPPPSPSSPSPSNTSLHPNRHSPSPCCPCSQDTSLACRPAPARALVLILEVRQGRTVKMQLKMCTGTRGRQQPLLRAQFDLRLLGATHRYVSRGRPALGPAPPAARALSLHTASPVRSQQAMAPCTPHPQESREGDQHSYHVPLHLHPWG